MLLFVPFTYLDAILGHMLKLLQGFQRIEKALRIHLINEDTIDRLPNRPAFFVNFRHNVGLHKSRYRIEAWEIRVILRVSIMCIDEMQDNSRDDQRCVSTPMVEFFLAFIIRENIGQILCGCNLALCSNGNFFERIPSGTAAIFSCWLKLDDNLSHAFSIASCNPPVFRLDVVDDHTFFPAAQKGRDNQTNTFAASGWRNDGKVFIRIIPQVKMLLVGKNALHSLMKPDIWVDRPRILSPRIVAGTMR